MRALLMTAAVIAATVAEARTTTADYWPNAPRNPYQANPIIARRLRCAALLEAVGNRYFGAGYDVDPRVRSEMRQMTPDSPRLSAADARERTAYADAAAALYDAAEGLGRAHPGYTHSDFQGWYGDSNRLEALAKLRDGVGAAALAAPVVRCFDYPQIAQLAPHLTARLRQPPPEAVPTTSPRIRPEWMPLRTVGYLARPDAYRYLGCAGLAHAVAEARFGALPAPDLPANAVPRFASPVAEALRTAVRDTFLAGRATLVSNSAAERQAYVSSFYAASRAGAALVKNGVAADAAREPALRCAELAPMAPALAHIS